MAAPKLPKDYFQKKCLNSVLKVLLPLRRQVQVQVRLLPLAGLSNLL